MAEGRKHVLVVEDDASIRRLIAGLLRDRGYQVSLADSGGEALAEIRKQPPDLVMLDLMMPGMNGWAFLEARERDRDLGNIPVLVVSAAGPTGVGDAQDLGAPVYVAKPFDVEHLLSEVDRLCAGPIRQCAWCRQVTDEVGRFRLRSGRKLRWATHGICPTCRDREQQSLLS